MKSQMHGQASDTSHLQIHAGTSLALNLVSQRTCLVDIIMTDQEPYVSYYKRSYNRK